MHDGAGLPERPRDSLSDSLRCSRNDDDTIREIEIHGSSEYTFTN